MRTLIILVLCALGTSSCALFPYYQMKLDFKKAEEFVGQLEQSGLNDSIQSIFINSDEISLSFTDEVFTYYYSDTLKGHSRSVTKVKSIGKQNYLYPEKVRKLTTHLLSLKVLFFWKQDDLYFFKKDGFLDSEIGFVYSKSGREPEENLRYGGRDFARFKKISQNWYKYSISS